MKKKFMLLFLVTGLSLAVTAQQKKPITVKIQTPGALCDDCKKRLEEYLKYEDGITKVVVYPKSKYTQVTYLADRTNIENIRTAINNAGYDADETKASEDSYKMLPKTCKKPEDGGHRKS